jgi:endonuclease/exonuclease/phosphatase family metal-dependent hydrolase
MAPRAIPDRAPAGAEGVRVRILAANVAGNDFKAPQVLRAVRRWRVDVFSVVELPPRVVVGYERSGADVLFPHRALQPRVGFRGTGLYSRLPLRPLPSPPTEFALAAAELRAPGAAPVDLISVHVPAPTQPGAAAHWRHDMRTLPAGGAPGPVRVLAGDFNATLDHAELRRLIGRGYHDAAEQAGTALRPTWPEGKSLLPTLITIDHVLADRRVRVLSAHSVRIPGSDHRGVLAELLLPRADRGGG